MFNTIMGYKEDRVYQLIPVFGGGVSSMGNATHFDGHTYSFILSFSLINKFRVSDLIDINVEMRGIGTRQLQDAVKWENHTFDCPLSLTAGVSFKIGKHGFTRASGCSANRTDAEDAIRRLRAANDSLEAVIANSQAAYNAMKADHDAVAADNDAMKAENLRILAELAKMQSDSDSNGVMEIWDAACKRVVFFDRGKAVLYDTDMPSFDVFAKFVKETTDKGHKLELMCTSDAATGTLSVNEKIMIERGEYVKNLLVGKYGVPAEYLSVHTALDSENTHNYVPLSRCVYVVFE